MRTSGAALMVAMLLNTGAKAVEPVADAGVSPPPAVVQPRQQDIRAQLSPRQYTTIASEIGAKINSLPLQEGASFQKGQVLVSFDCVLQETQLSRARAVLAGAKKTAAANERLAELRSIGAIELENSRTEVAKGQAEVDAVAALLGKCAISAPFSGRIAEQRAREQQYVQPGQPIFDILDDSTLEIEFIVPSAWIAWIKEQAPFQVSIDETGKTYPAKVTRIGARVDPVSQSIKIVAAIDGHFSELIAGMSGRIIISPPAP